MQFIRDHWLYVLGGLSVVLMLAGIYLLRSLNAEEEEMNPPQEGSEHDPWGIWRVK